MKKLKNEGIIFESGLTEDEFKFIEDLYGIKFPPDLKLFLGIALPISNNFVNWRDYSEQNIIKIREKIEWPLEGMIFDIEANSFWYDGWGQKPSSLEVAVGICKREFKNVPQMIPICSHRYISSKPFEENNPVFSIYQTDIIYYGENLESYLKIEFHMKKYEEMKLKT